MSSFSVRHGNILLQACCVAEHLGLMPPVVEQPQYSLLHRKRVEVDLDPLVKSRSLGLTTFSPLACGLLTGKYSVADTNSTEQSKAGAVDVPQGSRFSVPRYGFLAERWLTPEKIAAVEGIRPIAESLGTTPACLAIAFCIANPGVSSVITGATRVEQLHSNLRALDIVDKITPEIIQKIEQAVGGGAEMEMGAL